MKESHVVTCFIENDGQVLIVKRSSRVGTYQQRWSGISGYIEPGKTAVEQAWQELDEEVGLNSHDTSLLKEGDVLIINDEGLDRRWLIHPFRFALIEKNKIKLDWENTEYVWIDPERIPAYLTVPGLYAAWKKVE